MTIYDKFMRHKVHHGQMHHPLNMHYHNSRYCAIHGSHGPLYKCKYYSRELINIIDKHIFKFREAIKHNTIKFICINKNDNHYPEAKNIDHLL